MKLKHGEYDQKFARRSFSNFMFVGRIDGLAPSPRVVTLNGPHSSRCLSEIFQFPRFVRDTRNTSHLACLFSPLFSLFFSLLSRFLFPTHATSYKLQVTSNQQLQTKYIHSICSTHTYKTRNNFKVCMITRIV